MTVALLLVVAVALVNAPRARHSLPDHERRLVATLGAALTLAAVAVAAVAADPLLDLAAVEAATARIAAGVLATLWGLVLAVTRFPGPEPALPGRRAALVPVAFPVLCSPALAALAVSAAADRGPAVSVLAFTLALATVPLLAPAATDGPGGRALDGLARLLAATAAAAGLALVMDGVFDL